MSSPTASIYLRPMAKDDLDSVLEIAATAPGGPNWSRSTWIEIVNPGAPLPRITIVAVPSFAAPNDNAVLPVLGFAVASLLPPQAELETIAVAQSHQRQGVGSRLLSGLIEQLRQTAIAELLLEVRASNLSAIGLYRSFGFAQTGARARYYVDPVEDAILMALRIE